MPFQPHLPRRAPLLAAVAFTLLVVALAFRSWDRYVEDRLGRWAVAELAGRTDSTYHLVLGDLSFLPLAGSLSFDSATIVTDSVRNHRRKTPLPGLRAQGRECRVSGVDVSRLLFRRSFEADALGCRRIVAVVTSASREKKKPRETTDTSGIAAPMRNLVRPLGLSAFRIAEVSFPALSLTFERLGRNGDASVVLEHARFHAADLVLDLSADSDTGHGVSADRSRLEATGLLLRPDSATEITVARLEANLTDSTLVLADAEHEPSMPDDEWVGRQRVRKDRVRFALDGLRARGVAYRAFAGSGNIGIRAVELRGARLDVLTDKRIPKGPPRRHRTPQQVAVRPGPELRLDTVLVTGGTVVYRERKPERERPGVVTFDTVRATVLDLDLPSRGRRLRIDASARLMEEGLLTVQASVPLDAPDFRYQLSGKLGRMSAKAFNRFLGENEPFEFDNGWVEGIGFRQDVKGGRATTTLTPRYRDLSVEPTGEGGGLIGSVKRAAQEFVAQTFVVRSRNPDEDGKNLRTARTVRRYDPAITWVQFLWFGLRDGLMEVLKE
ncbi:MAG: hypothetical protein H0V43_05545 [Gemmatimonadales bacterium]|nr:hypothetical protein [Gemmatimonadales bacterium]MBA3554056.1 hypothetical protein [Gemmatimonadales bacterium]